MIRIEKSAFGPVRAVAAEHVVAHWLSEQGGEPTLYGGRRKGHDIVDGEQLVDAKLLVAASTSETNRFPGCNFKLRRDLWKPFDAERTTHIMLVEFPADWRAESTTSFAQTTITIHHEDLHLYLVPVADFNELLLSGRAEAEEKRWAFIILDDTWLEEHRVR